VAREYRTSSLHTCSVEADATVRRPDGTLRGICAPILEIRPDGGLLPLSMGRAHDMIALRIGRLSGVTSVVAAGLLLSLVGESPASASKARSQTVDVAGPLPVAAVGQWYDVRLTGGSGSRYSLVQGGTLPKGVHLHSHGVLSGKPHKKDLAGTYAFKVRSGSDTFSETLRLVTTRSGATSVASVQADDTGTINGTTTSIGSGKSNRVLAHDTGIGHSVVLMIQTLTYPGTETDTVTSISSRMGTFHFVNSYNDGADTEIWVCTDTTGAADSITVNTPTNAWDALAVEFNAPAAGFINGSGQVVDLPYLGDQSWTVSPRAAGNVAFIGVDTADAFQTRPKAPWTSYNSGYWSFVNGTSAAWQAAPSSVPLRATWVQDGGESSSQGVVLEY
jgi:hypothetical protein